MAGRKFFVCGFWKCEGTYWQVKKIKAILSQGEVPPSSVVGLFSTRMNWLFKDNRNTSILLPCLDNAEVVVCPPGRSFQYLEGSPRPDFQIASETCVYEVDPAIPWGPSTAKLVEKSPWIILGRFDRKLYVHRGNEVVGVKVAYALSHGLKVIACVGETIEQRRVGKTMEVVAAQIKAIAEKVTTDWKNVVLAYVPVWAVGTGHAATPAQAQEVHTELRKFLHANVSPEVAAMTRIIYGGSVGSANCKALASQPDIDGFFVGDASIKSEFIEIINSVGIKSQIGRLSEHVRHLQLS